MRLLAALVACLLAGSTALGAKEAIPEVKGPQGFPLPDHVVLPSFDAPVHPLLAADESGKIYSLDYQALAMRVFDEKGRLQEEVELQFLRDPQTIFGFDVNATGRVWALYNPRNIYYFDDEGRLVQELELKDPPAQVMGIALTALGSTAFIYRNFFDYFDTTGHTLIGRLDKNGKEADVAFPLESQEYGPTEESHRRLMILDVAGDGRLWVAERGRYQIWELTSSGRELTHIEDAEIELDFAKGRVESEDLELTFDATRPPPRQGSGSTEMTLTSVIRDFQEHNGKLWLIVQGRGERQQLDLVDPTTGKAHVISLPPTPHRYNSLAVTDRHIVLSTSSEEGSPATVLDRAELLFQLQEREEELELAIEKAEEADGPAPKAATAKTPQSAAASSPP